VFIDVDEWRLLGDLLGTSLHRFENPAIGHLQLQCRGRDRTWAATDRAQLAVLRLEGAMPTDEAGAPVHDVEVLVNPRILRGLEPSDAMLQIAETETGRMLTLEVEGLTSRVPEHPGPFPDWEPALGDLDVRSAATATVEQQVITRMCVTAAITPPGFEDPDLVAELRIAGGEVVIEVPWSMIPSTDVRTRAEVADGEGSLWIDPRRLLSLVEGLPEGPLGLRVLHDDAGLVVERGDFLALLFPVDMLAAPRARLEELLRAFLDTADLVPDDDGDYPIRISDDEQAGYLFVRLDHPELPTVSIFSVLAADVDPSPALFAELNSINVETPQLKVVHSEGSVMAEIEIVATNLDMDELAAGVTRVREAAANYRPLLEAFFGGTVEEPD
jgi:hypothetical protein